MPITGIEIYPTDELIWINITSNTVKRDDFIIVKTSEELEEAAIVKRSYSEEEFASLQKEQKETSLSEEVSFLRVASELDLQKIITNKNRVTDALEQCAQKIHEHNLDMHLVTAHFSFLGKQVMFIFTADGRVDFRNLVKDLAKLFKKQIRLKQIGPRDRAKYIGGYGKCGRALCCSTFLDSLDSVTMDMARVQNLHSKGSSKISGVCSKLLCCLGYEVKLYEELRKNMPSIGAKIMYQKKRCEVIALDVLNQTIKIQYDDGGDEIVPVEKVSKVLKPTT